MSSPNRVLYLARAVLEAATPLSVSTGSPDGVFDSALVRDANGLPTLPGTSLAGILRHLWARTDADAVFGYQRADDGCPSRLTVSWGALLDSNGQPVEGLLLGSDAARLSSDPLLAKALAGLEAPDYRNRVRLSHRGATASTGKFDRVILPAGNRFAIELRLWAPAEDAGADWGRLLGLLAHPGLRIGGATRAGLGRLHCIKVHQRRFDLADPVQADAFRKLGRGLGDATGLESYAPRPVAVDGWLTGRLELTARGLWRIGQGIDDLQPDVAKPADLLPVTEEQVSWEDGKGHRKPRALLIPGASLKGALAHRMSFHANRLAGVWADPEATAPVEPKPPEAVAALLGEVKQEAAEASDGRAGCLFIDDAFVPIEATQIARLMHNAIDRFTGGVRDRVLYEEQSLLGGNLSIDMALDLHCLQSRNEASAARRALRAALDDLCRGRLGLGSRTTAGNGLFSGKLTGTLADWLDTDEDDVTAEFA